MESKTKQTPKAGVKVERVVVMLGGEGSRVVGMSMRSREPTLYPPNAPGQEKTLMVPSTSMTVSRGTLYICGFKFQCHYSSDVGYVKLICTTCPFFFKYKIILK